MAQSSHLTEPTITNYKPNHYMMAYSCFPQVKIKTLWSSPSPSQSTLHSPSGSPSVRQFKAQLDDVDCQLSPSSTFNTSQDRTGWSSRSSPSLLRREGRERGRTRQVHIRLQHYVSLFSSSYCFKPYIMSE